MGREGENSEKYLVPHEELAVQKNTIVNNEMLNCIDCMQLRRESLEASSTMQRESPWKNKNSVQKETLNHINVSLISAPCQVPGNVAIAESTDVVGMDVSEEEVSIDWS